MALKAKLDIYVGDLRTQINIDIGGHLPSTMIFFLFAFSAGNSSSDEPLRKTGRLLLETYLHPYLAFIISPHCYTVNR